MSNAYKCDGCGEFRAGGAEKRRIVDHRGDFGDGPEIDRVVSYDFCATCAKEFDAHLQEFFSTDNGDDGLRTDGGDTRDQEDYIDLQRLANAEPQHPPADAPRDANDDPIFGESDVCISEAPAAVCRTLADPLRLEAVQLLAGAAARTNESETTRELTLRALAQQLAGCAAVSETDVERLQQELHHNHLPALHRANALHYESEAHVVETTLETDSYARLARLVVGFVAGDGR